jgi:osmotically-inducible protein OsmY
MLRYRKWVLSLGIAAATAGVAIGPFPFLNSELAAQTADARNQQIAEQVAQQLRAQKLRGFDIEIVVQDGVCRLGGKIADARQKEMASQVASQVPGINSVQNQLTVLEQTPSAATPASDIQQAAFNAPAAPAAQSATARQPSQIKRTGFFSRLKSFGNRRPQSTPSSAPSEQQVAVEIGQAISQMGLRGHKVDLKFQRGIATLTGSVQDPQQVAMITQVVSQNPFVRQVDNRLAAPGMRSPIQPAQFNAPSGASPAASSNQAMAEQIAQAIGQYQINGMDVEVRYNNGLATLTGQVAHPQLKMFAQQIVMSVPGVQNVNNQITFGPPPSAIRPVAYQQPGPGGPGGPAMQGGPGGPGIPGGPGGPQMMVPPGAGPGQRAHGGGAPSHLAYDLPNLPEYSWPTYASYPNYASLSYPKQYSASAWPYVGPFYPYPQVPLGWRQVQMEWDDGSWNLNFNPRTEKWFWYLDPKNW